MLTFSAPVNRHIGESGCVFYPVPNGGNVFHTESEEIAKNTSFKH